jgi:flotillin
MAAPLANVDKITIVSTGDGNAAGLNRVTGDMTKIAAQIPALFETLSGMQMSDLLSKVTGISDRGGSTAKPNGPANNG